MSPLAETDFERFRALIHKESGIFFGPHNRSILESRLAQASRDRAGMSLSDFYQKLVTDPGELKLFLDAVTTNLTKFFRNEPQFDALEKDVLPEVFRRNQGTRRLRIWSAGCSTGEEPYSLAISVLRSLPEPGWDVKIWASDISLKALLSAKQGWYPADRVQHLPPAVVQKYFHPVGDGFQVTEEVRRLISFDYHNLQHPSSMKDFDVVFCRNVIIYFDEPVILKVLSAFSSSMRPGGFLFLGHSESLLFLKTDFKLYKSDRATLYWKPV